MKMTLIQFNDDFIILFIVCTKWRETSEHVWTNVKELNYITEWPQCEDLKNRVPCHCKTPLHVLKFKFSYIPNLFALCGHYVQTLNISQFNNSIILTALKGRFPNLLSLCIIMCEWKDEHVKNLFTGMTKLEWIDIKWSHCKIVPPTFFEALNDVVDTLKVLMLWNMEFHVNPCMEFESYYLEDSCLPVCHTNSN